MKTKQKQVTAHHKKRSGSHQKRSKRFANVYLPYLPMALILLASLLLSGIRSFPTGVLAFATDLSTSGLLAATNQQRTADAKPSLTLNSNLSKAAQAKANDMTSRNYWSHNTPDGQEPWVFIVKAGYDYLKAGENLAYGFATSGDTINGWMNSQTHKDNMLDGDFSEVGFGFANADSYNNAGEETVVVAMYGKPQVRSLNQGTLDQKPSTSIENKNPTETQESASAAKPTDLTKDSLNSSSPGSLDTTATSQPVTRVQSLLGDSSRWTLVAVAFATGIAVTALLMRHGFALKRLLRNSELFVLHHPLIDGTLLAVVILGLTLTRTVGFIR